MAQGSPVHLIFNLDLVEPLDLLTEYGSDPRSAFGPGDKAELFRCNPRKLNPSAFQSSNEFSCDGIDEEFLAVEQCVYGETMIDRFDEVAYSFDEEETAGVAIFAIALKPLNFGERCRGVYVMEIRPCFIIHSPFVGRTNFSLSSGSEVSDVELIDKSHIVGVFRMLMIQLIDKLKFVGQSSLSQTGVFAAPGQAPFHWSDQVLTVSLIQTHFLLPIDQYLPRSLR